MFASSVGEFLPASSRPESNRSPGRADHTLADWSFSLYVVHSPLIVFLAVLIGGHEGALSLQPSWGAFLQFAMVLIVTLWLCWLFAQMTERHTESVRRWVYQRLDWTLKPLQEGTR